MKSKEILWIYYLIFLIIVLSLRKLLYTVTQYILNIVQLIVKIKSLGIKKLSKLNLNSFINKSR